MNYWSLEQDEILIDFVRGHEALYNIKSNDYRKTQMKQKLWSQVGCVLNKTGFDCSKRWAYVRDYYLRRKGKPGTGSSREAAVKRSQLLSFLDALPSSQRISISNIMEENVAPNYQDTEESQEDYAAEMENSETNDFSFSQEDENTSTSFENQLYNQSEIKRKYKGKRISHAQERLNLLKKIAERTPSTRHEITMDENDLFFNSMSKTVKKLPRFEQVRLRMQIASLVGNAELRHCPIDSPITSVSSNSLNTDTLSNFDYTVKDDEVVKMGLLVDNDSPQKFRINHSTNSDTLSSRTRDEWTHLQIEPVDNAKSRFFSSSEMNPVCRDVKEVEIGFTSHHSSKNANVDNSVDAATIPTVGCTVTINEEGEIFFLD